MYDGSGNRIEKKISSNNSVTDTVTYVNDITKPNEEVISLVHNGTTVSYIYGLDRLYEGNEEYLHDSFGNVIEHSSETYEYTPYGDLISGTIDSVNEYGYKGEVHDTESLQYLRARYYHTSLMQFISEDSYTGEDSNPLSQNRYTFVQNNPYKYSDPSGHSAMFEEKDGSVVTTPPTSTQKQDIPQQPKSEPAKTPSTTITSTYDHVDTTLNEFIHQQMNEDPFYGRINPYEEIEETAGIDPMNAYIHTYKNEHIKRGDPVSSNGNNKVSEENKDDDTTVYYDLMSTFYSSNNKPKEPYQYNELGNLSNVYDEYPRETTMAFAAIFASVGASFLLGGLLPLAITKIGAIFNAALIGGFSGAFGGFGYTATGEIYDYVKVGEDKEAFLESKGFDNSYDYALDLRDRIEDSM